MIRGSINSGLRALARTQHLNAGSGIRNAQQRASFNGTRAALASGLNVHREVAHNSASTPFEFTAENYTEIKRILRKYPKNYKASAVISLLDLAQRQCDGWLPLAAMNKVARVLDMAPIRVYEVATFYTMFNREKVGRNNVQVCCTTPCMIRGGYDILDAVKKRLGVNVSESTPDGMFHLMEVECLGACVNAPMLQINDHYYEDLTPETAVKVIDDIAAGRAPKIGPQIERNGCEGPKGRTTLTEPASGPYCRDLDQAMATFKEEQKAAEEKKKK